MPATPKPLGQLQLGTGAQTLYTVPAIVGTIVQEIVLTNVTASERLVSVYVVPSGGAVSDANAIMRNKPVPGGQYEAPGFALVMPPGATLQASCDAAVAVNIRVSGSEVS